MIRVQKDIALYELGARTVVQRIKALTLTLLKDACKSPKIRVHNILYLIIADIDSCNFVMIFHNCPYWCACLPDASGFFWPTPRAHQ